MFQRHFTYIVICLMGLCCVSAYAQGQPANCCTVIDIDKDSGVVVIRDVTSGWITSFKPGPLEFAEVKIGDSVDVSRVLRQVSKVNGRPATYDLRQPNYSTACCEVVQVSRDKESTIAKAQNTDGSNLRFMLPDTLANRVMPGQKVFIAPTHGFAMLLAAAPDSTMMLLGFPLLPEE